MWAKNANRAKKWSEPEGKPILKMWHDSVQNYDKSIQENYPTDALGYFYIIPACLTLVQPYITRPECKQWFKETAIGFGNIVHGLGRGTVSLPEANTYMIERYPAFDNACGSPH